MGSLTSMILPPVASYSLRMAIILLSSPLGEGRL